MAKRTVEAELAELKALSQNPDHPDFTNKLTHALQSKQNLIAARAAGIVLQHKRTGLVGELIAAFGRFLSDPKYSDKGCTAKTAIAKALYELGDAWAEPVFRAGVKHVQKEGSFGPPVDVATELRGLCGLGLVRIGARDYLNSLVDLLADPESQVRCIAARALAYSERPEAALLVRFKLLSGDREVDVITECMNALVRLQPRQAPQVLGEFLDDSEPEIRMSAALALGETRQSDALELLRQRLMSESDRDVRKTILISAGLLRLPAAIDWLISRLEDGPIVDATSAIESLAFFRRDESVISKVRQAVEQRNDSQLRAAWSAHFSGR